MVGQMGIVWNRIQPWLMEVERLRLQVGSLGANALNAGEFSPVVAVPSAFGTGVRGGEWPAPCRHTPSKSNSRP